MGAVFVLDERVAEGIRSGNEKIMNSDISSMRDTINSYSRQISELERQVSTQSQIASTAMKWISVTETVTSSSSSGSNSSGSSNSSNKSSSSSSSSKSSSSSSSSSSSKSGSSSSSSTSKSTSTDTGTKTTTRTVQKQVPDTEKRAAASKQAASLREQIQSMKRSIESLNKAISNVRSAISTSNAHFRNLVEIAQRTDMTYAEKLQKIKEEIELYNIKMKDICNSFNDTFPLSSSLISKLQFTMKIAEGRLDKAVIDIKAQLAGYQKACVVGGDPINLSTGNFLYTKDDIEIPGRFPLTFKRFYNAVGGQEDGVLGADWTHNYNIRLYAEEDLVHIILDDGHTETYQYLEDEIFVGPLEHGNILQKSEDGYFLTTPSMQQYLFDGEGMLQCIADMNRNCTEFTYTDGLLTEVYNPCGCLSLSYDTEKHLTKISDNTGRQTEYEYADNRLIKVTQPSGAVCQYEYNEQGRLSGLINPLGISTIRNEYDENGRAIRQHFADGGVYALNYDDDNLTTTVIEQNGNKIQHIRDEKFRTIKTIYADSEEHFEYNECNMRTLHSDRNGNVGRYEYDVRGNLLKATDPFGNVTATEYNIYNKPVRITNPDSGTITNTYDERGNLTGSIDPIDRTVSLTNDDRGLVTRFTQPDSSKNDFSYDERGNILSVTDATGNQTRYEYDGLNRVVKTIDPNGHATHFTYNTKGDITKVTNAEGHIRTYEYSALGKLTKMIDLDGEETAYHYSAMGKLEEFVNPSGSRTRFAHDKMGNITGVTDPLGNILRYEYNQLNRLVKTIDQEGNITQYMHDPNGNVTAMISPLGTRTEISYDALDRPKEIREADGAVTQLAYDAAGRLIKVVDPQKAEILRTYDKAGQLLSLTDQAGNTTHYTYNALGQPETVTDALGGVQIYRYYPGGRLESVTHPGGESERYEYDRNGNIVKVTDGLNSVTAIEYDCMNRIKTITNPLGHSKRFGYDALGNITSVTDENGNTTTYGYSPTGELIIVTDALGHSTRYGYDSAGRMTRMEQYRALDETYADLKQIELQVTTWERNKRGEVTRMCSPLGDASLYNYDAVGNLIAKTDEDGLETLYEYNLVNKLSKATYADGKTVELSYNPLRQLTEMRDWLGTTSIEVDALGHATKVTDYEGKTVQYEWDALDRREAVIYPDESKVSYSYNKSGRLEQVVSETGGTQYSYDAMGRISERNMPGGITTQYKTDPLGRLESLTHRKNREVLDQFRYTYDPVGNITEIDKHRVDTEKDNGLFRYTYDPLSRLVEAANGETCKQYQYDNLGNRIMSIENGVKTRYNYNARNQLIHTQEREDVRKYSYDRRGNLTSVLENGTVKASYVFDATNRMTEALSADRGRAEYVYNGFLQRVKRLEEMNVTQNEQQERSTSADPTHEMRYILDLTKPYNNLLATEGIQTQRYVWGNELLIAEGENPFNYLHDHLGSPIRLVGNEQEEALIYDEFGVPTVEAGGNLHNPFGFTGYQIDDVSGLYYAQARYYDPATSRMLTEDTHWNTQNMIYGDSFGNNHGPNIDAIMSSTNLYAYCYNNPIIYNDPEGEIPILVITIAGGAVIGAIVGGGANIVSQIVTNGWDNINWKETGVSAIGGAASGALVGSGAGIFTVVAGNAAIGAGTYAGVQVVNGEDITVGGVVSNAVLGAIFGVLGGTGTQYVNELKELQGVFQKTLAFGWESGQMINKQLFVDLFMREARASFFQGWRDEIIQFVVSQLLETNFMKEDIEQVMNFFSKTIIQCE